MMRIAGSLGLVLIAMAAAWIVSDGNVLSMPGRHTQPHVVVLVLDTLRADYLPMYSEDVPSEAAPELAALAEQGVSFSRAISQSSWTRPSVASLLTSRYPRDLGIYYEKGDGLPDSAHTMAEAFKAAGYRTLGLTANPNLNRTFNFQQGYDEYIDSSVVWGWMDAERDQKKITESPLPSAPALFDRAIELIEATPPTPTLLWMDLMEMHAYLHPEQMVRPEFLEMFEGHPQRGYAQSLRQLSHDVGAFVVRLQELPGWQDTLFVITSDHGEGLDSHPNVEKSSSHGQLLYESQNWVPLIIFHPGDALPAGRVIEQPVRLLDLMPTLLDYAGVPAAEGARGISLRPLIDDPTAQTALPEYIVSETRFRGNSKLGLYGRDDKLIHSLRLHKGTYLVELQPNRILEDGSRTDIGHAQPERRAEMLRFLDEWRLAHPSAAQSSIRHEPSPQEAEQLKAIGYVQ